MKRVVRPKVIEKTIDILVTIDDFKQFEDIAAAKPVEIRHPSIKKSHKLSDDALSLYTGFIKCIVEVIENHDILITDNYQSGKSYAYYIDTETTGYVDGERVKFIVHFRIGDHPNYSIDQRSSSSEGGAVIAVKKVQIGSYVSENYARAMLYFNKVCEGIRESDLDVMNTEMVIFD